MTELETATQQLADTRNVITAILKGGQAYGINGRSSTKADLGELR